jgi:dihydroorotase
MNFDGPLIVEGLYTNCDSDDYGQIAIDRVSGLIVAIGKNIGSADIVAGRSSRIFPGFIDNHVHAREDASGMHTYKEDFCSASAAAIAGGVTAFSDMPNNPVPPVDDESYAQKRELSRWAPVPILHFAAIGPNTRKLQRDVPYKIFMAPSFDGLAFETAARIEQALVHYVGCSVSFHAEHPEVLARCGREPTHEKRRPVEAEVEATRLAIELCAKYSIQGRIIHCSSAEAASLVFDAKKNNLDVICEVTPHHLYFDETMIVESNRNRLVINPPIRTAADRLFLIEALRTGKIEALGTDHSPHTVEEKRRGFPGMPHLDTYGAFATWLVKEHNFTFQDIVRVCALNPAKFQNAFGAERYGRIAEGYTGSLTIVDFESPVKGSELQLRTKSSWTPFRDTIFPGRPLYTVIKGVTYSARTGTLVA